MGEPDDRVSGKKARGAGERFARVAFAVALAVYPALLWRYTAANSATYDEAQHIAAGYSYWHCGDYGNNPEHPPLVKLIAAYRFRDWHLDEASDPCGPVVRADRSAGVVRPAYLSTAYGLINGPRAVRMLNAARQALIVFPLLLLVTVFFAARGWFGPMAAGWAVLLTVFDPNLTAHGGLVTTDVPVTAATLLSVFCAWRLCQRPGAARVLWLGLAMGLALAVKHSGALAPAIVLLECLVYAVSQKQGRWRLLAKLAGGWMAACVIAVVVLWGVYQFRFAAMAGAPSLGVAALIEQSGMTRSLLGRTVAFLAQHRLLPESYLAGLIYVVHNTSKETFLFGREMKESVWYYFPVVLAIKTPLTILALLGAGLAMPGFWKRHWRVCTWLALPVAVFLAAAMASGIGLGLRHILPLYPFLLILAAGAAAWLGERFRWGTAACAALAVFGVVSYARSFPNEIAYANEAWGGPPHLRRYLNDSNLEWGQSLYLVKEWVARHPVSPCWIAWFGMQKPESLGIPCQALAGPFYLEAMDPTLPPPLPERFGGVVLISAVMLDYDLYPYRWFRARRPDDVIGAGVLVYRGEFDRPEVAAERHISRGWWLMRHDRPAEAAADLAESAQHANLQAIQHWLAGWAAQELRARANGAAARR